MKNKSKKYILLVSLYHVNKTECKQMIYKNVDKGVIQKRHYLGKGEEVWHGVTQYGDVTHSVVYIDHLFYFFIFINHNSSCLLYHLFHVLRNIINDCALNSSLLSFDLTK